MAREMASTASAKPQGETAPSHDDIARRAYEIYLERGRPDGRDMEHWLEAEAQISAANQRFSVREAKTAARRQASR